MCQSNLKIRYFIHDEDYAGISAFANKTTTESERSALMLAVGALLPLSYGRMGKSWKHAEGLIELARYKENTAFEKISNRDFRTLVKDPENTQPLEDFWIEHQVQEEPQHPECHSQTTSPSADRERRRSERPSSSQQTRTRNRAISSVSALAPPGKGLTSHHPALSLPIFLDTFGPLVFPLYKAALLRQRILLVGNAPVELACNYGQLAFLSSRFYVDNVRSIQYLSALRYSQLRR